MFLNKMKEQQDKSVSFPTSSPSHYQTAVLTIPTSGTKTDGGGQTGIVAPVHPSHSTQNLLPVPSTGIMTAGVFLPIKILSIAPILASSCLCHRITSYLETIMHFNITMTLRERYSFCCAGNMSDTAKCVHCDHFLWIIPSRVIISFYPFWFLPLGYSRPGHHHSSGDSRLSHVFSIICLWSSSCNDYDRVCSSFTWYSIHSDLHYLFSTHWFDHLQAWQLTCKLNKNKFDAILIIYTYIYN